MIAFTFARVLLVKWYVASEGITNSPLYVSFVYKSIQHTAADIDLDLQNESENLRYVWI